MKLSAFLNKPNDEAAIEAAVERYNPKAVDLFLPTDNARLDEATVGLWHVMDRLKSARLQVNSYSMNSISPREILEMITGDSSADNIAVALPTSVRRAFLDAIPLLRRTGIESIEIPDGLNSAFGLLSHSCAVRLRKTPLSWIKTLRAIAVTPSCKADVCFFPFHPLQSFLAKRTLPAPKPRIHPTKTNYLKGIFDTPRPLVIGLKQMPAEEIASRMKVDRYIATCKDKGIIIDGRTVELPFYLCAEELLAYYKPSFTIGYASNAVVMAKIIHPDRPACIINGILKSCGFGYYEHVFNKAANKIGVDILGDGYANYICSITNSCKEANLVIRI